MKKAPRLRYILLIYLLGICFFTVFRITEVLVYCHQSGNAISFNSTLFKALFIGWRFDTIVSCYLLALPLLLTLLGELTHIKRKAYYSVIHYFVSVAYTVCLFACAADIPYFCYFFSRLDASMVSLDSSLNVVTDMILTEPSFWIYLIVFILVATSWWLLNHWIYRKLLVERPNTFLEYKWSIPLSVILIFCLFVGMRGRLRRTPLRAEAAVFCNDAFLNQIGLNPVFTFIKSSQAIFKDKNNPIDLIDITTAQTILREQQLSPRYDEDTVVLPHGTNVILVLMESMGAEKTSLCTTPNQSLTPHLDSLMNAGITFTEHYSAGTHTFNGIYSTLYSHPAIFAQHAMRRAIMPRMCGIPHLLASAGYSTAYFMPHQEHFDGMNGFLLSNGFELVVGESCYPPEEVINSYGIPDHILFDHALEHCNNAAAEGPFFTCIMTCSDHPPYALPDIEHTFTHSSLAEKMVEYADWSIGRFMQKAATQPWFNNTIFIFVADHGCSTNNPIYDMPLSMNHVPLTFYAPHHIRPKVIDRLALQIDVMPTLMGMLGITPCNNILGIDLLRQHRQYAFFGAGTKLGVVDGEYLYIYRHENNSSSLYDYKRLSPEDLSGRLPEKESSMRNYAFSMIQLSHQMLKEGSTSCNNCNHGL